MSLHLEVFKFVNGKRNKNLTPEQIRIERAKAIITKEMPENIKLLIRKFGVFFKWE